MVPIFQAIQEQVVQTQAVTAEETAAQATLVDQRVRSTSEEARAVSGAMSKVVRWAIPFRVTQVLLARHQWSRLLPLAARPYA